MTIHSEDLQGKVAVVTGATRGIGRAVSLRLASAGVKVYAGARSQADLQVLEQEHNHITGIPLDVADPDSVNAFANSIKDNVSFLINNAGVGVFKPIDELTVAEWDRIFNVNVRGTFLVTQVFLANLRKTKGHIINVTSDVSARTFAGGSLYTASKYAQRAFTRALQMEVQPDGVRVTEVRPGVVATYFNDSEPQTVDDGALSPEDVTDAIMYALTRPTRMRVDEIMFHPHGQDVEF